MVQEPIGNILIDSLHEGVCGAFLFFQHVQKLAHGFYKGLMLFLMGFDARITGFFLKLLLCLKMEFCIVQKEIQSLDRSPLLCTQ